jgi:hypothetical protein
MASGTCFAHVESLVAGRDLPSQGRQQRLRPIVFLATWILRRFRPSRHLQRLEGWTLVPTLSPLRRRRTRQLSDSPLDNRMGLLPLPLGRTPRNQDHLSAQARVFTRLRFLSLRLLRALQVMCKCPCSCRSQQFCRGSPYRFNLGRRWSNPLRNHTRRTCRLPSPRPTSQTNLP